MSRRRPGWGTALFKSVFTGNDSTLKRAVPVEAVRTLRERSHLKAGVQLARDLFLFSLYACGISFVDLVYLRPENLRDGYLVYTRRKTGRQIMVKMTSAMQGILARYAPESKGYLLPFLDDKLSPLQNYVRYCSALALYNRRLKRLGLSLTSYVARLLFARPRLQKIGPTGHFACQRGNHFRKNRRFPCRVGHEIGLSGPSACNRGNVLA